MLKVLILFDSHIINTIFAYKYSSPTVNTPQQESGLGNE